MKAYLTRSLLFAASIGLLLPQAFAADSEFIENMPALAQDPDRAGAMIWTKPGLDRAAYTRVMIEPITIFVSPDSDYKGLSADDLQALAIGFVETLTQTLEPDIPVVNQSGAGVLYMRAALTNVKLKKKKRSLLGYTPVGIVVTAAKDAAGKRISLKDAVLELEMLDSASGERLGVLVEKAPKAAETEELSWDSISETFAYYAERFKTRMQAARPQQ
jgi:hypothetical protein